MGLTSFAKSAAVWWSCCNRLTRKQKLFESPGDVASWLFVSSRIINLALFHLSLQSTSYQLENLSHKKTLVSISTSAGLLFLLGREVVHGLKTEKQKISFKRKNIIFFVTLRQTSAIYQLLVFFCHHLLFIFLFHTLSLFVSHSHSSSSPAPPTCHSHAVIVPSPYLFSFAFIPLFLVLFPSSLLPTFIHSRLPFLHSLDYRKHLPP